RARFEGIRRLPGAEEQAAWRRRTVMLSLLLAAALPGLPAQQADRESTLKAASAAMAGGRRDEARQLLRDAGTRFGSVRALLLLARMQSNEGDPDRALVSPAR